MISENEQQEEVNEEEMNLDSLLKMNGENFESNRGLAGISPDAIFFQTINIEKSRVEDEKQGCAVCEHKIRTEVSKSYGSKFGKFLSSLISSNGRGRNSMQARTSHARRMQYLEEAYNNENSKTDKAKKNSKSKNFINDKLFLGPLPPGFERGYLAGYLNPEPVTLFIDGDKDGPLITGQSEFIETRDYLLESQVDGKTMLSTNRPPKLWTQQEDLNLLKAVKKYKGNWKQILNFIEANQKKYSNKTIDEGKRRWVAIKKEGSHIWTDRQDQKLIELVEANGKHWAILCKYFPDLQQDQLRNRYELLLKKDKVLPSQKLANNKDVNMELDKSANLEQGNIDGNSGFNFIFPSERSISGSFYHSNSNKGSEFNSGAGSNGYLLKNVNTILCTSCGEGMQAGSRSSEISQNSMNSQNKYNAMFTMGSVRPAVGTRCHPDQAKNLTNLNRAIEKIAGE